jgi:serine/threonine protein kinase
VSTAEPRPLSKYELPRGASVGKYEILRKIATGGMAELYLARVRGTAGFEKVVVLKRILPGVAEDPTFVQMFLDEARLAATLQHPNIADVYDVGEADGQYFFTMEFVHGQDVRTIRHEVRKRNEPVPLSAALAIVHGTASALDYAHERRTPDGKLMGLVHRDVSASNIMVSYDGAVKLLDFGIARVMSATHKTQVGTLKGKIPYMSPEQCKGLPLDRRSDLFSLGVVLFELTVGRRPFRGDSDFAVMDQIVYQGAPKPSSIVHGYPGELEAIVMKLLERDPKARYTTGDELVDELDTFIQKYGLWLSPKQLGKYMRTVFSDRIKAWEEAEKQGVPFTQHVAESITSQSQQSELLTPPSAFPALERRSSQIMAAQPSPEIAAALRPTPPSMQAVQPPPSRPTPPAAPKPGFAPPAALPFAEGNKATWEPPSKTGDGWDAPTQASEPSWDPPSKAGEGWDAPTTDFRSESPTSPTTDFRGESPTSPATPGELARPVPGSPKVPVAEFDDPQATRRSPAAKPIAGVASGLGKPLAPKPPPELPLRAPPPGMTPPVGMPAAPPPRASAPRAASDTFTPPTIPDTSHAPGFVPATNVPAASTSQAAGSVPAASTGHTPGFVPAPSTPAGSRAPSPDRLRPPTASAFASDAAAPAIDAPAFSESAPSPRPRFESQPVPTLRPRSNRIILVVLLVLLVAGAGIAGFVVVSGGGSSEGSAASTGSDTVEVKAKTEPLDTKPAAPAPPQPTVTHEPEQPADTPKPGETSKPAETSKPVGTSKPAETSKPAQTPKPAETPKPAVAKDPKPVVTPKPPVVKKPPTKPKDSSWDPNSPFLPQ